MNKTLCTTIEKWLKEHNIPILQTQPLPCFEGSFWAVLLTEHLYILIKDAKINLIQLVPYDDGDSCKVRSLAALESADPKCFPRLQRAIRRGLGA